MDYPSITFGQNEGHKNPKALWAEGIWGSRNETMIISDNLNDRNLVVLDLQTTHFLRFCVATKKYVWKTRRESTVKSWTNFVFGWAVWKCGRTWGARYRRFERSRTWGVGGFGTILPKTACWWLHPNETAWTAGTDLKLFGLRQRGIRCRFSLVISKFEFLSLWTNRCTVKCNQSQVVVVE